MKAHVVAPRVVRGAIAGVGAATVGPTRGLHKRPERPNAKA